MLSAGGSGGEVAFYGGTFTSLESRHQEAFLGAVRPQLEAGRVEGIRISTRPDALDEETVQFLSSQGVTTVEIGCQSFDASVLERSNRGHGPDVAAGAVRRLRKVGMRVGLQLMPGLPGGDRKEARRSLETALALSPDFLRIYPAVVFAGTPLAELYREGRFSPWSLEEAVIVCAGLWRECRQAKVDVIRMGLQGNPHLESPGRMLDGPFHPAFGQLVRSRCWLEALQSLDGTALGADGRVVYVHGADLADAVGHRRDNLKILQHRFGSFGIAACADIPRGWMRWGGRFFDPMHPNGLLEISS